MKVYTEVGHYKATSEVLFDLLSKPENLPKWAITFCKKIEKKEESYHVTSPDGDELFFRIDADKKSSSKSSQNSLLLSLKASLKLGFIE